MLASFEFCETFKHVLKARLRRQSHCFAGSAAEFIFAVLCIYTHLQGFFIVEVGAGASYFRFFPAIIGCMESEQAEHRLLTDEILTSSVACMND